jgi:hypothetical protein
MCFLLALNDPINSHFPPTTKPTGDSETQITFPIPLQPLFHRFHSLWKLLRPEVIKSQLLKLQRYNNQ